MSAEPPPALPVHSPPGALDAVLALDRPGMLSSALDLHEFEPWSRLQIGPFDVQSWLLPHWVPNAGVRVTAADRVLAYSGDTGPSEDVVEMARDADLLLAEATHVDEVPEESRPFLSTTSQAGRYAAQAGAGRLLLTHLWPGDDPEDALAAAAREYDGDLAVATTGTVVDLA